MSSQFPPQSRMPTLVPQRTETLWYPRQKGVEHLQDELLQEEKAFENRQKSIGQSGTHFIPVGLSKRFMDFEEQDEEEEEEEEEEDDDAGAVAVEQDLDAEIETIDAIDEMIQSFDDDQEYFNDSLQRLSSPTSGGYIEDEGEPLQERDLDDDIEEAPSYSSLIDEDLADFANE
ncbi:hypothetical protein BGZ76_011316 [Entomortierella beljakovae]|nr:hypothetical protein BGZ76_011316 [Entomortierella beljakovae]